VRAGLALVVVLCVGMSELQAQGSMRAFSFQLRGSYTTSSRIFLNPEASTIEARNQHLLLDGIPGAGAQLQYRWPDRNFFLGLSVDYILKRDDKRQLVAFSNPARYVPVQEGFLLIPIELGLYAYIPVGSERFRVTMGGGVGMYLGERILTVAGVNATPQPGSSGYGIHVESGFEYQLAPRVWLKGGMRFRDPEVTVANRFEAESAEYNGTHLTFSQNEFKSKINAHGLNVLLGVVVELF
jgi:hypothetical protein